VAVTRPDRRRGRRGAPEPSPVKRVAEAAGLPVTDRPDAVLSAGVELGVVVAYGRILRPPLLGTVPLVNVHFSLLPRWRGAAPVERAILAGDDRTGVCLMEVEAGLDTGPVYRRRETPIGADETAAALTDRLAALGRDLLLTALDEGLGDPVAQAGEATYARKIEPEERHLDWTQTAIVLHRVVRIGHAWTTLDRRRLLVLEAAVEPAEPPRPPGTLDGVRVSTGDGTLRLVTVQPEGRPPMAADAWRRGLRVGDRPRLGR